MDVVHLDDSFTPDYLIEDYSTMIWTERYQKNGEFELHTPRIEETQKILDLGDHISLLDSDEVMTVENFSIEPNEEGVAELVVTGRTFETFLENRLALNTYGAPWKSLAGYTIYEILALILWTNMVYNGDQDVTIIDGIKDDNTSIPNTIVTLTTAISEWIAESDTWTIPSIDYWLNEGAQYQPLLDFMAMSGLGVRNIRPHGTTALHIEFNTTVGLGRGMSIIEEWTDISQLRFDVYSGTDRTRFQSDRPAVIFHYSSGHIDGPKYLFSIADWKTMAEVSSSIGRVEVGEITATGLSRRVLYVDGGSLGDLDYDEFAASLTQKGEIELAKHNQAALFDGAISPVSPYKYGTDYSLGDLVTVLAQYGIERTMRVDEFIRTETKTGEVGRPTLVLVQ
jgi:hypothetical protein